MDNFCTPINQLGADQPPNFERDVNSDTRKEPIPVQNYSDILKNVQSDSHAVQKPVPMEYTAPPPIQQHPPQEPVYHPPQYQHNHNTPHNEIQQKSTEPSIQNLKMDTDFQNDSISLLSVYFLLSSECVQAFIKSKIPSMVDANTNKVNTFGIIINGIILLLAYNFAKKIIVKYIKDA